MRIVAVAWTVAEVGDEGVEAVTSAAAATRNIGKANAVDGKW